MEQRPYIAVFYAEIHASSAACYAFWVLPGSSTLLREKINSVPTPSVLTTLIFSP